MNCKACNKGGFKCMECEGHEVKLLPCPFCGGEAIALSTIFDKGLYRVSCDSNNERECKILPSIYSRDMGEAIQAWNTRMEGIIIDKEMR